MTAAVKHQREASPKRRLIELMYAAWLARSCTTYADLEAFATNDATKPERQQIFIAIPKTQRMAHFDAFREALVGFRRLLAETTQLARHDWAWWTSDEAPEAVRFRADARFRNAYLVADAQFREQLFHLESADVKYFALQFKAVGEKYHPYTLTSIDGANVNLAEHL